jgi:hypothetical protein
MLYCLHVSTILVNKVFLKLVSKTLPGPKPPKFTNSRDPMMELALILNDWLIQSRIVASVLGQNAC